jgi:hypothetical protein
MIARYIFKNARARKKGEKYLDPSSWSKEMSWEECVHQSCIIHTFSRKRPEMDVWTPIKHGHTKLLKLNDYAEWGEIWNDVKLA